MKVALIDKRIDYKTFIGGLKSDVYPIFIEEADVYLSIANKIKHHYQEVTHVVIAQHLNDDGLQIGAEPLVKYSDRDTWSGLKQFLTD